MVLTSGLLMAASYYLTDLGGRCLHARASTGYIENKKSAEMSKIPIRQDLAQVPLCDYGLVFRRARCVGNARKGLWVALILPLVSLTVIWTNVVAFSNQVTTNNQRKIGLPTIPRQFSIGWPFVKLLRPAVPEALALQCGGAPTAHNQMRKITYQCVQVPT